MTEDSTQYWSMTEGVFNCLIDTDRTQAFQKAIQHSVRKGDVVVDLGTGSGVLAMFAAECGASKVYAVELDEKNIQTLRGTFKDNGYEDRIVIIAGDATRITLPEKVDVIIAEMVATGLIEELQVQAMNNILPLGKRGVRVLLHKMEQYIDVVFNNNLFYGRRFNIVRYEYADIPASASTLFTQTKRYSTIDFSTPVIDTNIDVSTNLVVEKDGTINGLRISNKTFFFDGSTLGATFAYCFPLILPIDECCVTVGSVLHVDLRYTLCGGMTNLKYSVQKLK